MACQGVLDSPIVEGTGLPTLSVVAVVGGTAPAANAAGAAAADDDDDDDDTTVDTDGAANHSFIETTNPTFPLTLSAAK